MVAAGQGDGGARTQRSARQSQPLPPPPQSAPCSVDHCAEASGGLAQGKATLRCFVLMGVGWGLPCGYDWLPRKPRRVLDGVREKGQLPHLPGPPYAARDATRRMRP